MATPALKRPRPLFRYYGSKFKMAPLLERLVPPTTKVMYSMFLGSGAFEYYYADRHPECQIVCFDSDPQVINMHRWAQREPLQLYAAIKRKVMAIADGEGCITKDQFKLLMSVAERNESSLAGAAAFYILSSSSFSGKTGTYARHPISPPIELLRPRPQNLTFAVSDALKELSKLRASKDSFVYLDPPYLIDSQVYYRHHKFDHEGLSRVLHKCPIQWLLSYNDIREVRSLYKGFHTKTWHANTTTVIIKTGEQVFQPRVELMISNRPIRNVQ
jgi:DNA adenine methylase